MVDRDQATEPESSAPAGAVETRRRIRSAARLVVARRGFDTTVDDIAAQAGVSPRTVFRHYSTRDALIVDAVKEMFEACGRRPIEGLPSPTEDLDGWIDGLARTIHTRNVEIVGQAFWDMHTPHDSAILEEIRQLSAHYRLKGVGYLVDRAWTAAGGHGRPPAQLTWAFGLNFSVFTTQALTIDFCLSPVEIGSLTARLVKNALREAIAVQDCRANGSERRSAALGNTHYA